jgi:8-amino-3,8-dideoxy-alpha-D-manno-octulosonate transaminase
MPGFEWFGAEERKQVQDVMDTGVLMRYGFDAARNGIWKAKELEQEVNAYFGCNYSQLTSSGTAALTTVMAAMGIGYGHEVIMPTFTFVASFEAVISVGAIPVLVDVDETLTLSPDAVRAAITPNTKCVMPVHMCGSMANLDALKAICDEHNLYLLEDACQSIGGTYNGKKLGTIGHAGTFSFDYVKTMTCGEGGVIMMNSQDLYEKCDGYTDHGHDHKGVDRGADLHPFIGYNFRISELHAAVGLAQIKKVDAILVKQNEHYNILRSYLEQIPEVTFRQLPAGGVDSCNFLSWFLPTEELTREAVKEMGILKQAGNFYWFDNNWHYIRKWDHLKNSITLNKLHPDHKAAVIAGVTKSFPVSDAIMGRCVSTAISLTWTPEQLHAKGAAMKTAILNAMDKVAVTA